MLTIGQKLTVITTCLVIIVLLLLFFPWYLAAFGIISMAPFIFAVTLKN